MGGMGGGGRWGGGSNNNLRLRRRIATVNDETGAGLAGGAASFSHRCAGRFSAVKDEGGGQSGGRFKHPAVIGLAIQQPIIDHIRHIPGVNIARHLFVGAIG